jgi:hypothetical protein
VARPWFQAAAALLLCLTGYLATREMAPRRARAMPASPAPPTEAAGAPQAPTSPPFAAPPPHAARPAKREPTPTADAAPRTYAAKKAAAPEPAFAADQQASGRPAVQAMGEAAGAERARPRPAPPEAAQVRRTTASLALRLTAREPQGAEARVAAAFRRAGASFQIARAPGRPTLSARVPARSLSGLYQELEALGDLEGPRPDPNPGDDPVQIDLSW